MSKLIGRCFHYEIPYGNRGRSTPYGPRYFRVVFENESTLKGIYIAHDHGETELDTGMPMSPDQLRDWTEIKKGDFDAALENALRCISERVSR